VREGEIYGRREMKRREARPRPAKSRRESEASLSPGLQRRERFETEQLLSCFMRQR